MNVRFEGFTEEGLAFLDDEQARLLDSVRVSPDDVLLNITGASIGRVTRAPGHMDGARVNQHVCIIRPVDGVLPAFVEAHLASPVTQGKIFSEEYGVTRQALTKEQILGFSLPLPPLAEQGRIVAKLDELRARSQKARAALDAVPALLDKLKQSVLAAAFRGDLTAAWRAAQPPGTVESVPDLLRRVKAPPRPNRWNSRSAATTMGFHGLSVGNPDTPLPDGWAWVPLADVARLESGHTPSREHPEWWGGDVPWVSLPDAREHHERTICQTFNNTNELGLANSAARLLPTGTVCLSRTASVGYATVLGCPMATSQDFVNWVCTEAVEPHWLKYLFVAEKEALIKRFGKGSTHTTVYFPEVLSFHVALPPVNEQRELVSIIDQRLRTYRAITSEVLAASVNLDHLDQSILAKAFRGELVPQDPNDEPAETLLARIQAETRPPNTQKGGRVRRS